MITKIYTSYSPGVCLMLDMCWSSFHTSLILNYTLHFPHVVVEISSCLSHFIFIVSLRMPYLFLMVYRYV